MTATLKVNLGCADRYVDGWVNVDWAGSPHKRDVTLDFATDPLPWAARTVTHAYLGHLLEHIEFNMVVPALRKLRKCMSADGRIMIVGPDVDRARAMIAAGTFDFTHHTLESIIHGDTRWPGTEHKWTCTASLVSRLLEVTSWSDVEDVGIERVDALWPVIDRAQLWQCAVTAVAHQVPS